MKFKMLAAFVLVLVAGCSGSGENAGATAQVAVHKAATVPTVAVKKVRLSTEQLAYSRLPEHKVRFDFPFNFKSDKAVAGRNGQVRGTMALSYRGTPAEQVWKSMDAAFQKVGYRSVAYKVDSKQRERRQYLKKGAKTLTITVVPDAHVNTEGAIWLNWRVAQLAAIKAPVAAAR
jgi:hypothetical protein